MPWQMPGRIHDDRRKRRRNDEKTSEEMKALSHQHEVRAAAAMEADGDIARACLLTMCGLPGAGKSTLARAVAARAESDGIRVSLVSFDDVERRLASEKSEASASRGDDAGGSTPGFDAATWKAARLEALATVERLLLSEAEASVGEDGGGEKDDRRRALIIADDNFYYAGMRQQCHRIARRTNAAHAQLFVSISVAQAHARNESRHLNDVVPRDALERMADQFEPPAAIERDDCVSASRDENLAPEKVRVRLFERDATVTVDAERLGLCHSPFSSSEKETNGTRVMSSDDTSDSSSTSSSTLCASDVNDVWLRVREKWTRPATVVGTSAEALLDRRRLGSAANAASAAHALDVRSRRVLSSAMASAAANDAFAGMSKQARGALSGALNDARREMVDAVRALAKARGAARDKPLNAREADGDDGGDGAYVARGDEDGDDADDRDAELEFVAEMNARESRFAALCREMLSGEVGR
jgi:O-phosphoseryl-tRNA(Sec) kinase